MTGWTKVLLIVTAQVMLFSHQVQALTPWQKVKTPVKGSPQAVGEVTNGCLIGGKALPRQHSSYQVLRADKLRYFGHPDLIKFIQRLTAQTEKEQLGTVLVGDMAMPAGGRFTRGHRSHQSGLDVDIWLQLAAQRWTAQQLTKPVAIDLVDSSGKRVIEKYWSADLARLIKLSAQDKAVTRIFVHPAIKQKLCETAGNDRSWLTKVRPWFGHRAHMHIRINCPSGSQECVTQPAPPAGDGCGSELDSWLADSTPLPSAKPQDTKIPPLPAMCQRLIDNKFQVK